MLLAVSGVLSITTLIGLCTPGQRIWRVISGGGLEGAILEEEERLNGSEVEGEILVEIFKIDGENKVY